MRKEAGSIIPKMCRYIREGIREDMKLSEEKQDELDAAVKLVEDLCLEGRLMQDDEDANNCIYRILAMVPFPAKLANDDRHPMIKALGKVFDITGSARTTIRKTANLLVTWGSKWIRRFSEKRNELLPINYYFEKRNDAVVDAEKLTALLEEMFFDPDAIWEMLDNRP